MKQTESYLNNWKHPHLETVSVIWVTRHDSISNCTPCVRLCVASIKTCHHIAKIWLWCMNLMYTDQFECHLLYFALYISTLASISYRVAPSNNSNNNNKNNNNASDYSLTLFAQTIIDPPYRIKYIKSYEIFTLT